MHQEIQISAPQVTTILRNETLQNIERLAPADHNSIFFTVETHNNIEHTTSPQTTCESTLTPDSQLSPTLSETTTPAPSVSFGQDEIIHYDTDSAPTEINNANMSVTKDLEKQIYHLAKQLNKVIIDHNIEQAEQAYKAIDDIVTQHLESEERATKISTNKTANELKNKINAYLEKEDYPNAILHCVRLLFSSSSQQHEHIALYKKITQNITNHLHEKSLRQATFKEIQKIFCLRESNLPLCLTKTLQWQERHHDLLQQAINENNQDLQHYCQKQLGIAENLLTILQQQLTNPLIVAQRKATGSPDHPLTTTQKIVGFKNCVKQCDQAIKKIDLILTKGNHTNIEISFYYLAKNTIETIKAERLIAMEKAQLPGKNGLIKAWSNNNPNLTYTTPHKTGTQKYTRIPKRNQPAPAFT